MLSDEMKNGIEQIKLTFEGAQQYIPITAQINSHTMRLTGKEEREFFSNPETFIHNHLLISEYYGLDAPSMFYDIYNIEAEALGQELIWMPGRFPEINESNPLVADPADLTRLKAPDFLKDGRMPFIIDVHKRLFDLEVNPSFRFCAPFTLASKIRGLSNLLMDIIDNPAFVHRLFEFLTFEILIPWVETIRKECGSDIVVLGADAMSSLPIVNLQIIEEFSLAYILKMQREIKNLGVIGWWGEKYLKKPEKLLELKLSACPNLLVGYDPDVHAVGPEVFADFAESNQATLMLGLDSTLLLSGPVSNIINRVKSYVEAIEAKNAKGYLFLNEIPHECPSEHVHAAVQATKYFGNPDIRHNIDSGEFRPEIKKSFDQWITENC